MSTNYLTLVCPHCEGVNDYTYYAHESCPSVIQCEHCGQQFNITENSTRYVYVDEMAGYADEIAKDSKALEDLVASFGSPMPVISQLAIAIEETLIVYHEPYFVRWACRALQGIVNRNFNPYKYSNDETTCEWGVTDSWAEIAAKNCVLAARQPVPSRLIEDAAIAIECALRAQDVMAKKKESDE